MYALGQTAQQIGVRAFIRCIQAELRRQGYAVPLDGLWSRKTRETFYRATTAETSVPRVGSNIRWIWTSLAAVHDRVAECAGGEEAYGAAAQAFVRHAQNLEARGHLEGTSGTLPWGWFIAGAVVTTVLGVTGLLALRRRRAA
jgi:hypothetical protein